MKKGATRCERTVSDSTPSHSRRILRVRSIEILEGSEVDVLGCGGVLVGGYLQHEREEERRVSQFCSFARSKRRRKRAQK